MRAALPFNATRFIHMPSTDPFHPDFVEKPFWWEAAAPTDEGSSDVPARTSVAILGSGYGGLSAGLELARNGVDVTILEADLFGSGASTRNGGALSAGINLGKGLSASNRSSSKTGSGSAGMLYDAEQSYRLVERLIEREGIDCHYENCGKFIGAFVPEHYKRLQSKLKSYNNSGSESWMVSREEQRREIGSDYYFGGMIVNRTSKLHPSLYHQGLRRAVQKAGGRLCARARVERIEGGIGRFVLHTSQGPLAADEVIVATNGYTGTVTPGLRRRLIPVTSHIIVTEELPKDLAASLIPNGRTVSDTRRVLTYFRLTPDGRRLMFGGRPRFTDVPPRVSAKILHEFMVTRFPQLKGYRISHAWNGYVAFSFDFLPHMGKQQNGLHYCLACNGSGITMMTYLGNKIARKILEKGDNPISAFDGRPMPTFPLYNGNPWFLPVVGNYYRMRDGIDRIFAGN